MKGIRQVMVAELHQTSRTEMDKVCEDKSQNVKGVVDQLFRRLDCGNGMQCNVFMLHF